MYDRYQHPDITAALIWGYPHKPPLSPVCPVCGYECGTLFLGLGRDVVACDVCVTGDTEYDDTVDAWEEMEY